MRYEMNLPRNKFCRQ